MASHTPGGSGQSAADIESGKLWAILGYIFQLLAIVPLVQKDNDFAMYHAKQALVLLIIGIPTCGFCVVGAPVLIVMGVINAVNGKYEPLPLIGKFAESWFGGMQKNG